jgi:two-component system, LytTR family, response regulator
MDSIKVLIIDDEQKPRELLEVRLHSLFPHFTIVGNCGTVEQAFEVVLTQQPNLIFVDIEMPYKNGLEFIQILKNSSQKAEFIITSAYNKASYLLEAINLGVSGYLIKPIIQDELVKAVDKAITNLNQLLQNHSTKPPIILKSKGGKLILDQEKIVYIVAKGNYSTLHFSNGKTELILESLAVLSDKVQHTNLIRADKSHIINPKLIERIDNTKNLCYFQPITSQPAVKVNNTGIKILNKLFTAN